MRTERQGNRMTQTITVDKFTCADNLLEFTDSLLFDSGTKIAYIAVTDKNGCKAEISLEVRGEVRIRMKGADDWERRPSEYPEDLRSAIENGQFGLIDEDANNNWFELMFTVYDKNGKEIASDGDVFEGDVSLFNAEDMKQLLADDAQHYINCYIYDK